MLHLALRLSHETPWSPRLVVGVVSLGWACVSCVCASVMWAQVRLSRFMVYCASH